VPIVTIRELHCRNKNLLADDEKIFGMVIHRRPDFMQSIDRQAGVSRSTALIHVFLHMRRPFGVIQPARAKRVRRFPHFLDTPDLVGLSKRNQLGGGNNAKQGNAALPSSCPQGHTWAKRIGSVHQ
jgi:hypothetical protein